MKKFIDLSHEEIIGNADHSFNFWCTLERGIADRQLRWRV
jgi:hypothetical protein